MEILINRGEYDIIEAPTEDEAYEAIERAGRVAHQSEPLGRPEAFVRMLRGREHFSVFEFSGMTVRFKNLSRGHSHELVRHRLFSFVQESTRYVDESNLRFVMPPGCNHGQTTLKIKSESGKSIPEMTLDDYVGVMESVYRHLLSLGWKKEDARQFLPIGTVAEIIVRGNFREWRHYFSLRTDQSAHWEIRSIATKLLEDCKTRWPAIFDDFHKHGMKKDIPYYRIGVS